MPFADQLSRSKGCKAQLELWHDAEGVPPRTREALRTLIDKLSVYVKKAREKQAKQKQLQEQRAASARAAEATALEHKESELQVTLLRQQFDLQIGKLQHEIAEIQQAGQMSPADMLAIQQKMGRIGELNQGLQSQLAALCGGGSASGAGGAIGPAALSGASANPAKRRKGS